MRREEKKVSKLALGRPCSKLNLGNRRESLKFLISFFFVFILKGLQCEQQTIHYQEQAFNE